MLILLDSLTRLARAYNKGVELRPDHVGRDGHQGDWTSPSGSSAPPGTFDEGGSLTVLATALVETGSRMDELIFQEFKGTGNMEVVLDRQPGRPPRLAGDRHPAVRAPARRNDSSTPRPSPASPCSAAASPS